MLIPVKVVYFNFFFFFFGHFLFHKFPKQVEKSGWHLPRTLDWLFPAPWVPAQLFPPRQDAFWLKRGQGGVRLPLGTKLDVSQKEEKQTDSWLTRDLQCGYEQLPPPLSVAKVTVRRAAQLFCNRLCSSETFSGLLRKVYVFIYWLAVMCSHGSVTVDPVRGDRRICHMNLSFAMLIEILLSYPKFS